MEISIDEARKVYLGGAPVHLIELDQQLAHTAREQAILPRVDAGVPFSDFVQVLDLAAEIPSSAGEDRHSA
ncbi:MAG: hypothetical protein P3W87_000010 [Gammaproteobacteria bacterium]|nr:hypothetical protein [Gammaproteobacteria bacterium]